MAAYRQTGIWGALRAARRDAASAVFLALATAGTLAEAVASESQPDHAVPYFPSASDALGRQGFTRVINHSSDAGDVSITAFDDDGESYGPLTLSLGVHETAHFNSDDLENGNTTKGLTHGTGAGRGDWRLELTSDLDIEVLSYVRARDGFLTSMHDTAPWRDGGYRVAFFNPGSNRNQESLLRLVNVGEAAATVTIAGTDDAGMPGSSIVTVELPARASRTYSAAELESQGAAGLVGSLGDGVGKWQLAIESEQPITVLSLVASPGGHLTNLSSSPASERSYAFNFDRGEQGFIADFADYPPARAEIYELTSGYRLLPAPLEPKSALFISGVNRSDDLFMFFKGQVGGLAPGARYDVSVSVEIASDTPAGCIGVGGAPGESVWIKAGASETEPLPILEGTYLRMNIDIGNQSNGGDSAVVLGNVANSRSCEESRLWELKDFPARSTPIPVWASPDGRVWLLFGVDSGFESRTEIYFTRATLYLTRTSEARADAHSEFSAVE